MASIAQTAPPDKKGFGQWTKLIESFFLCEGLSREEQLITFGRLQTILERPRTQETAAQQRGRVISVDFSRVPARKTAVHMA